MSPAQLTERLKVLAELIKVCTSWSLKDKLEKQVEELLKLK